MLERYPELCIRCPRQFFIFAETEGNRYEFDDEVKEHFWSIAKQCKSKTDIAIIPNSNHEYSILESQEDLLQNITNWFKEEIVN